MWRNPLVKAREWQYQFRRTPQGRVYVRNMNLRKYGITITQYDEMMTKQGGVCASCGKAETGRNQYGILPLAVDHDHLTNVNRGLLCMRCNRALGLLGDDPKLVRSLLNYRETH